MLLQKGDRSGSEKKLRRNLRCFSLSYRCAVERVRENFVPTYFGIVTVYPDHVEGEVDTPTQRIFSVMMGCNRPLSSDKDAPSALCNNYNEGGCDNE